MSHQPPERAGNGAPGTGDDVLPGESLTAVAAGEGGETACWAHLVCPACGAMVTEGHRPDCDQDTG